MRSMACFTSPEVAQLLIVGAKVLQCLGPNLMMARGSLHDAAVSAAEVLPAAPQITPACQ